MSGLCGPGPFTSSGLMFPSVNSLLPVPSFYCYGQSFCILLAFLVVLSLRFVGNILYLDYAPLYDVFFFFFSLFIFLLYYVFCVNGNQNICES